MTDWLNVETFKVRSLMPSEDVDVLESTYPGFLKSRLTINRSKIESRLRKRYAVPFVDPVPEVVLDWQERLTTKDAYLKRGFNPSSAQDAEMLGRAVSADEELKEAADSKDGLFDLPLRDGVDASAIGKGQPLACSDPTPYDWIDTQAQAASDRGGR